MVKKKTPVAKNKDEEPDWRADLGSFLNKSEGKRIEPAGSELARFITDVVLPAFQDVADELERYGRTVVRRHTASSAVLIASNGTEEELTYRVQGRTFPNGVLPYAEVRFRERKGLRLIRVESMFRSGVPNYRMVDITKDEIIRDFLTHYKHRVQAD
ncbi:MAG: hypothetical protein O3A51_07140 [Verrucomicrobia bacterium]|nr:hypothetical protein [Verrucomicrobiota bacterium]